jgi:hypothetical protein
VDIVIGIQNIARELTISSAESAAQIQSAVAAALGNKDSVLTLTDDHGRTTVIPASAIAYVEIGSESTRHIGFGAG